MNIVRREVIKVCILRLMEFYVYVNRYSVLRFLFQGPLKHIYLIYFFTHENK